MNLYKNILFPIISQLDAELVHEFTLKYGSKIYNLTHRRNTRVNNHKSLEFKHEKTGLVFPNRVGLAAGLDKNAQAPDTWNRMGFGFIEIGTVTAHAQPGNPQPRLFRLKQEKSILNRMGFNNLGTDKIANKLSQASMPSIPLGINIGKSKSSLQNI